MGGATERPTCRLCHHKHWPKEDHIFDGPVTKPQGLTSPLAVTKPRHANTVTKPVTPPRGRVAALEEEVERLESEVRQLKRQLADRGGGQVGRPLIGDKPMSPAERKRRERAKHKSDRQDFQG